MTTAAEEVNALMRGSARRSFTTHPNAFNRASTSNWGKRLQPGSASPGSAFNRASALGLRSALGI
jgi:hypothetical protein